MISQPQASILRAEEQHPRSILMQGRNNNNCILTDGTFVSSVTLRLMADVRLVGDFGGGDLAATAALGSRIILFRALVSGTSLYSCLGGLLPDWNCTEPEEKEDDGFEWDGASSGLWLSARSSVVSNGARGHRSATDGGGSGMLKMKT
ncbi:hypothetical protein PRIPAC_91753 [Pristionchus pacificus]|uniref:Uncharacterized protein n=1 Tax=Pristionchus pacificus TaxID=54126 RepID=A0A2A6BB11_PRIPA|nr:hypothetical protein PRIPAC_91753 [Pristionchus pacificus]|eukprot:PDM63060.1 hypothetical protein PRIPAC_50275 [Pristionchus pacificus]